MIEDGQLLFDRMSDPLVVMELIVCNSQGAKNLKNRSAQLTRQKRFDCLNS